MRDKLSDILKSKGTWAALSDLHATILSRCMALSMKSVGFGDLTPNSSFKAKDVRRKCNAIQLEV